MPDDHPEELPDELDDADREALRAAAGKLKNQIAANIVAKVNGGGIPTAREEEFLKRAIGGPGPGRPAKLVRWTLDHAASEFPIDRRTLKKRLNEASIQPGEDGKYSTAEICRVVYESTNARDEKDRQQAEFYRLQNEDKRKERIPIGDVMAVVAPVLHGIGATINAARGKTLTPELINEIFAQLRDAETACSQTQSPQAA